MRYVAHPTTSPFWQAFYQARAEKLRLVQQLKATGLSFSQIRKVIVTVNNLIAFETEANEEAR